VDQQPEAGPGRGSALNGLHDLVRALSSSRRFIDVLEIAGEQARAALGGDSLSLSQWDRDLGRLVTRVNLGELAEGEVRFPEDEVYELARDAVVLLEGTGFLVQADDAAAPEPDRSILLGQGMSSGVTMPIPSEGRLWGEMWVTRSRDHAPYGEQELALASDVAALIGDVIASGELLERTARMAYEDPLTRLANRRVFDDRLAELLELGRSGATVVLCDLDSLKAINDALGHEAGDRVIILAADALSVAASRVDGCVAARIGGDEFALILPGDVRAQAVSVAQRAAGLLERGPQAVTMSCGVAAAPAGTPPRTLIVTADAALYGAKHRGAQVLLSSDLGDGDHELLRAARPTRLGTELPRRRRWDDATDRPYAADASAAVADAVQALADGLDEVPRDLPAALRWVGDTVLGPLDLDRWVLNSVSGADGAEHFLLDSLGLRHARLGAEPLPAEADIAAEAHPLTDFPVAADAVRDGQLFEFELGGVGDDGEPGPGSELLQRMGMRFVVGAGAQDETGGWLLTVYGSTDHVPVTAVREVVALALAAVTRQDDEHD
jgi:diguanylate cyclase (GGDEF)-like protein